MGAQDEFHAAYEHYRKKDNKEALACALKAFESVLKVVCEKKTWQYDKEKATAEPC